MQWYKQGHGNVLVPIDRVEANALLMDEDACRVASNECAEWMLSTVFLCYNKNLSTRTPVFYETSLYREPDGWQVVCHYETRSQAVDGHMRYFRLLLRGDF